MQQPPMTDFEFQLNWNSLETAVRTLMLLKPGKYPPVSYEQTYSLVYKCVAHGYASSLHNKLISEVADRLQLLSLQLSNCTYATLPRTFNDLWEQYNCALHGIVPIFNYMNRFYVESRLNRSLKAELLSLFDTVVLQAHVDELITALLCAQSSPMSVSPSVVESLVKMIYHLRPEIAHNHLGLFQKFIPGLWCPISVHNIPDMMLEAKDMTQRIQTAFASEPPSSSGYLKRSYEENMAPAIKVFACEDGISHY